jgi:hypothetical protein
MEGVARDNGKQNIRCSSLESLFWSGLLGVIRKRQCETRDLTAVGATLQASNLFKWVACFDTHLPVQLMQTSSPSASSSSALRRCQI